MKKSAVIALGLIAALTAGASAAPLAPKLGETRAPVRVGELKPIKNVVLFNKPVVDTNGRYIGWVENVEFIGTTVTQVKVSTDYHKRASWLFAEHFKYDPSNDVVVTDATPAWIKEMSFIN